MINLRTAKAKKRELAVQVRLAATIERAMTSHLRSEFKLVATAAAAAVKKKTNPVSDAVMEHHRQNLKRIFNASWGIAIRANARRVFDTAGKAGVLKLERKATEDEISTMIQDYSDENTALKVKQVSDTTKAHIVNAVQRGVDDGSSIDEIAADIEDRTGGVIGAGRAAVIARTETHSASQAGSLAAADALGIPGLEKEWVAAEDERTRPDHAEANGQSVAMDDTFSVGQDELDYPGDPTGSPEQIINCRCATVFNSPSPDDSGE